MSWGEKKIRGRVYDLTHLDPFILQVTPKTEETRTFNVHISFGSHVFTEEWESSHTPDLKFIDGTEVRCFSIVRHSLSMNLPRIVRQAASGRAHFSSQQNTFMLSENLSDLTGPYAVFFNITKARSQNFDASMFVVSAYEKPNLPTRLKRIKFATLVLNTVRGRPIKRPKK